MLSTWHFLGHAIHGIVVKALRIPYQMRIPQPTLPLPLFPSSPPAWDGDDAGTRLVKEGPEGWCCHGVVG